MRQVLPVLPDFARLGRVRPVGPSALPSPLTLLSKGDRHDPSSIASNKTASLSKRLMACSSADKGV